MNSMIYITSAVLLLLIVGAFVVQKFFPDTRVGGFKLSHILWASLAFVGSFLIFIIRSALKSDALKEAELKLKMKSADASLQASKHTQEQNLKKISVIDEEVKKISKDLSHNSENVKSLMEKRQALAESHEALKKEIEDKNSKRTSIEDELTSIRNRIGE